MTAGTYRASKMGFIERRFVDPPRRMAAAQFEELALPGGETVFLGDSITAGGAWHEWFPLVPIVNRGVGGDTTEGVLARLDHAVRAPKQVFLLIGTNDLTFGRRALETYANARLIVQRIAETVPGDRLVVQSVMPRHPKFRKRIELLNNVYRGVAKEVGAVYLDLWPTMSRGDALKKEFTLDDLHLNGAGYRAWTEILRTHIEQGGASLRLPTRP